MARNDATTREALPDEQRRLIGEALTQPLGLGATVAPRAAEGQSQALEALRKLERPRAAEALELGQTIGEGGMGLVRSAVQRALGRSVAVKSISAELRTPDRELKLLREAWLTANVEHPNVVPVHDVIMDPEDGPLIVLKKVEGDTWSDLVDDPALLREKHGVEDPLEFNLGILMQVCQALHYAHSKGILHRDIKPANVMIGSFGEVYLLDWGVAASLVDDPSGRFPRPGEGGLAGTLGYMCPDMLVDNGRAVSLRSDVYLLGATLYRVVVGRPPHSGDDVESLLESIWASTPSFPPEMPPALVAIVQKAMHPDPGERHESAEALRLDLYRFLRHRASLRIVDETEPQARELLTWLDQPGHATEALYQRFGECRLALREALRGWPDNARARELLAEVLDRMIDYLLAHDDPGGAAALLSEHPVPKESLRARIDEAVARQKREREELARFEAEHDPRVGRGARRAALVAMGLLWTIAPLAANLVDPEKTPRTINYLSPIALLFLALLVWYRARASLAKTAINRRFLVALLVGFCAHMVHVLTVQLAGLPPKSELSMGMVSFGAIGAILAYTAERRLWPTMPLYWLGAVAAASFRDQSAYVLSACNLLLTLYVLAIWAPRRDEA